MVTECKEEWFSTLEDEWRWTMRVKHKDAAKLREVLFNSKEWKVNPMCRKFASRPDYSRNFLMLTRELKLRSLEVFAKS